MSQNSQYSDTDPNHPAYQAETQPLSPLPSQDSGCGRSFTPTQIIGATQESQSDDEGVDGV